MAGFELSPVGGLGRELADGHRVEIYALAPVDGSVDHGVVGWLDHHFGRWLRGPGGMGAYGQVGDR